MLLLSPRPVLGTLLLLLLGVAACAPVLHESAGIPSETSPSADSSRATPSATDDPSPSDLTGSIRIVEVYGARRLDVGEDGNFRVRLAPGSMGPVQYVWDFGDGIVSIGNNVTHRFPRPGRYDIRVIARNTVNEATAGIAVTVAPAPAAPAPVVPSRASEPVAAEAPFRKGDLVWVTDISDRFDTANERIAIYTTAGLRAGVLPTYQGGETAYLVAVGGYRTEVEAQRARDEVLRARVTPLWLLELDERRPPR